MGQRHSGIVLVKVSRIVLVNVSRIILVNVSRIVCRNDWKNVLMNDCRKVCKRTLRFCNSISFPDVREFAHAHIIAEPKTTFTISPGKVEKAREAIDFLSTLSLPGPSHGRAPSLANEAGGERNGKGSTTTSEPQKKGKATLNSTRIQSAWSYMSIVVSPIWLAMFPTPKTCT